MLTAFKARKPWAAAIITLIFGPVIGMCYINRGRVTFTYFVITILFAGLPFLAAEAGILPIHPVDAMGIISWGLNIIGGIHAFQIAKQRHYPEPFKWYSRWHTLIALIVVPMLIAFALRHFYYEPFHLPAGSMSPNANNGDYLFAKKFAYYSDKPTRGEVIIFKTPDNATYVKRVIGLPGDRIQIKDSVLYINDVSVPRKQIEDYSFQEEQANRSIHQFIETLPEGKEVKILDETLNGPFDNTPVYTVPTQQYFVLGDNRDNSRDSRDQKFGFIPEETITGKASVIWWNDKTQQLEWQPVK